ncbi:hypothetical protein [Streptosporangium sp. V21-05]|uniref:hypothetical protein n=1 Tax=Streptosporangium sp. V21-05 TaxID=3446115 RepID=UPI003F529AC3
MDALAGGTSFVPTVDGWLIHTPQEDFLTVEVDGERATTVPDLLAEDGQDNADLLEVLRQEGVLVAPTAPAVPGDVVVCGEGPLLEVLPPLLAASGLAVRVLPGEDAPHAREPEGLRDVAALVVATSRLRDERFTLIDEYCRSRRLPWHLGYAEGRRWYAGPFHTGPDTASYRDLRLRRLAASPWPRELAAHWAWLDAGGLPHPDPAAPIGAHLIAALITADLRAFLHGGSPPGAGVQVGADPATGRIRRHPVLPVPGDLLMVETP